MKFLGHKTVLKNETIHAVYENNVIADKKFFVDMTFGGGGHIFALEELEGEHRCIGLDQDPDALESGYEKIKRESKKDTVLLEKSNFVNIDEVLKRESVKILLMDIFLRLLRRLGFQVINLMPVSAVFISV